MAAGDPEPAGRAAAPAKVLAGLGCPACGGALEAREGWTNLACPYCGASLRVAGEAGVARHMVLDKVSRAAAEEKVRRWLGEGLRKAPGLAREARIEEAFLAWFPFVRTRFDVVGWVFGAVKRKKGNTSVEVPQEIQVERSFDDTRPAADMSEFGAGRVRLAGDQLLPLDEEKLRSRGMVFRPQIDPDQAEREILEQGMREARFVGHLHKVTFSWLEAIRKRTALVYYPLWVFRYAFRGRLFQALVDAEDGGLAYAQAPANALLRAFKMVAAVAGACFVATTALQSPGCLAGGDDEGGALVALVLGFVASVYWGYRQIRYGSVLEEGTGVVRKPRSGSADALLGKILSSGRRR